MESPKRQFRRGRLRLRREGTGDLRISQEQHRSTSTSIIYETSTISRGRCQPFAGLEIHIGLQPPGPSTFLEASPYRGGHHAAPGREKPSTKPYNISIKFY